MVVENVAETTLKVEEVRSSLEVPCHLVESLEDSGMVRPWARHFGSLAEAVWISCFDLLQRPFQNNLPSPWGLLESYWILQDFGGDRHDHGHLMSDIRDWNRPCGHDHGGRRTDKNESHRLYRPVNVTLCVIGHFGWASFHLRIHIV